VRLSCIAILKRAEGQRWNGCDRAPGKPQQNGFGEMERLCEVCLRKPCLSPAEARGVNEILGASDGPRATMREPGPSAGYLALDEFTVSLPRSNDREPDAPSRLATGRTDTRYGPPDPLPERPPSDNEKPDLLEVCLD